jgi:hypothetical protein
MQDRTKELMALIGDKDLIFEFFAVFSRFEYALKRSGFIPKGKDSVPKDGDAKADWTTYELELRGQFAKIQDQEFLEACAYITLEAPKKQVVEDGRLGWEPANPHEFKERDVLILLRRVRNNLFHGGKYPSGPVPDQARNNNAIRSCLVVLDACLGLSPNVAAAFNEMV